MELTEDVLDRAFGLHVDAAIGAHRERGADRLGGLLRADRHRHDLGRGTFFLQADRLFDGDLVEDTSGRGVDEHGVAPRR